MISRIQQCFGLLTPFLMKDRSSKQATLCTCLLVLSEVGVATAMPWLFAKFTELYAQPRTSEHLWVLVGFLGCLWGTKVLEHARNIVFFKIINQAVKDIRMRVILHLHQMPLLQGQNYQPAEVLSANSRVSLTVSHFMQVSFVGILPAVLKFISFSVAIIRIQSNLAYFPVLVMATYGYVYLHLRTFLQTRHAVWEATDKTNIAMASSLHNSQLSRLHLTEEAQRLDQIFHTEAKHWLRNNFYQHGIHMVQGTLFFVAVSILFFHLSFLQPTSKLRTEDLIQIKAYIILLHSQTFKITSYIRKFLGGLKDLEKILQILALPIDRPLGVSLPTQIMQFPNQPIFDLKNTSFSYPEVQKPILQNLSLAIHAGQKVAIIGPSGSGKSTLCHLLAGLYLPTQGQVTLYGTPSTQLNVQDLGKRVHFISQNTAVKPSMQVDPAGDLISHNRRFSGGESQRLLLTNGLRYQPEVLILDEILCALDEDNAQELLKMVLSQVSTVVLITHRYSFVKGFTHVYRLLNGTLELVENPSELVQA